MCLRSAAEKPRKDSAGFYTSKRFCVPQSDAQNRVMDMSAPLGAAYPNSFGNVFPND